MPTPQSLIRNFSIISHVDHGKSTLSDRILELTGAVDPRLMREQFLDSMDIERERGITIKAQNVRLKYTAKDGQTYQLQLIDTPGHVDFNYEVSRSLKACEGALLVVDATQGVEAQTLANVFLALDNNLEIVPVLNKIDLPSADVDKTKREIEDVIGLDCAGAIPASAKTGLGIPEILEAVVKRVPPPKGDPSATPRALIFDSWYDSYRGAVVMVRVIDGTLRKGQKIRFMATGRDYELTEMGVFAPFPTPITELGPGEVGFLAGNIKSVVDTKIGDTVTDAVHPSTDPLPGFKEVKPMVFAGIFPTDSAQYEDLRDALSKLNMNDAAFVFEPDTSEALGFGFRCGFLGLLHLEIVQERLEREFDQDLITTAPSVVYEVQLNNGEVLKVENPSRMPDLGRIAEIREPIVTVRLYMPQEYVGPVMTLANQKRGAQVNMSYHGRQVLITYEMPLAEIVLDFFDKLKSVSRGYASMDYEFKEYRAADVVKVDILLNGDKVDALAIIVHRSQAQFRARAIVAKMRELIARQMYDVAVQAAIGANIIARETIKALRKNVIAKCYGGDITRKKKLLEKQKAGKKRMKQIGSVEVPQEAFLAILQVED